jgi:hypothetical protein
VRDERKHDAPERDEPHDDDGGWRQSGCADAAVD